MRLFTVGSLVLVAVAISAKDMSIASRMKNLALLHRQGRDCLVDPICDFAIHGCPFGVALGRDDFVDAVRAGFVAAGAGRLVEHVYRYCIAWPSRESLGRGKNFHAIALGNCPRRHGLSANNFHNLAPGGNDGWPALAAKHDCPVRGKRLAPALRAQTRS